MRSKFPMRYPDRDDVIAPQHAVEVSHGGDSRRAVHMLLAWVVRWLC